MSWVSFVSGKLANSLCQLRTCHERMWWHQGLWRTLGWAHNSPAQVKPGMDVLSWVCAICLWSLPDFDLTHSGTKHTRTDGAAPSASPPPPCCLNKEGPLRGTEFQTQPPRCRSLPTMEGGPAVFTVTKTVGRAGLVWARSPWLGLETSLFEKP